jgi:predicted aminopeptidase
LDRTRWPRFRVRFGILFRISSAALLGVFLFSGCSSIYILRAAIEEGKILWRRQPIEHLLQKPDLERENKEKLKLVLAVREYARTSLKLNVKGSYASYSYVTRPVLSYVLMGASKTDLAPYTWWYLFVGRVPYKGFPSEEAARTEAGRFENRGYDTYIRTSSAYSTLGWFDDPLLAHLLKYDAVTLAEVIFHELLHNTFFLKGVVDFNESLANFVGNRAAIDFFRSRNGEGSNPHQQALQAWRDELEFSDFIVEVAAGLREVYARTIDLNEKLKLREEVFLKSQQEWTSRIAGRSKHQYRAYSEQKLNNAVLANYLLYLRDLRLFESLYDSEGRDLARVIAVIGESVQKTDAPFEVVQDLLGKRRASTNSKG